MIDTESSIVALVSVLSFTILSVVCFYCYFSEVGSLKLENIRKIFFLVLACSAALDIPVDIGCIVMGGPLDCTWNSYSFSILWICHSRSCIKW